MKKNILIMYVSERSGHHRAGLAIDRAFSLISSEINTLVVNCLNYTNPILEKIISRAYMGVITKKPEFWGYVYDNPKIVKKTQRWRDAIHNHNSTKIKVLIDDFNPDAVICTQAFPSGIVCDYKRQYNQQLKLFGVLTDYSPHSYWIDESVDGYFVPSQETGEKLVHNGVMRNRIIETGIPIDVSFKEVKNKTFICGKYGLDPGKPIILLMGGSQGIGPIREVIVSLNMVQHDIQIVSISGCNKRLYKYITKLSAHQKSSGKKIISLEYIDNVDELMECATLLISKPGGITTAEALTKGLPILIIHPIPGQEMMNTEYLMKNDVAIKVNHPHDMGFIVNELLFNKGKLTELSMRARQLAKPESSQNIASYVLANV